MTAQTLSGYTIVRALGTSSVSELFLADHDQSHARVLLKILPLELAERPELVRRLFDDARVVADINHPSMLRVLDCGVLDDGRSFIAFEAVDGESLADRLQRLGKLPIGNAVAIAAQVASCMSAAHRRGIVHRDLRPEQVIIVPQDDDETEIAKVLNFGIARLASRDGEADVHKTAAFLGKPTYMAPELCRGSRAIDARADVYSLGCMLFAMLCGRPPFTSEFIGDLVGAHLKTPPPAPRAIEISVSAELDELVTQALAKAPDDRPQTMAEFRSALEGLDVPAPESGWKLRALSDGEDRATARAPSGGAWRRKAVSVAEESVSSAQPIDAAPSTATVDQHVVPVERSAPAPIASAAVVARDEPQSVTASELSRSDGLPPAPKAEAAVGSTLPLAWDASAAALPFEVGGTRLLPKRAHERVDDWNGQVGRTRVLMPQAPATEARSWRPPRLIAISVVAASACVVAAVIFRFGRTHERSDLPESSPASHATPPSVLENRTAEPASRGQGTAAPSAPPAAPAATSMHDTPALGGSAPGANALQTVIISVRNLPGAPAKVWLDGRRVSLPARIRRDGARHVLEVRAVGMLPEKVTIRADRDAAVTLQNTPALY